MESSDILTNQNRREPEKFKDQEAFCLNMNSMELHLVPVRSPGWTGPNDVLYWIVCGLKRTCWMTKKNQLVQWSVCIPLILSNRTEIFITNTTMSEREREGENNNNNN